MFLLLWLLWLRGGLLGGQVSLEESVRLIHYATHDAKRPCQRKPRHFLRKLIRRGTYRKHARTSIELSVCPPNSLVSQKTPGGCHEY